MSSHRSYADTWVIVEIRRQQFAIPAAAVREIVAIPEVTTLPRGRPEDRGVITLRGSCLPVIDLRKKFGWQSVPEELADFCRLMQQREQDHRRWLEELERSVIEGSEFQLAIDPHKCAFGKWYDSYRSESPWVTGLLQKFEHPHGRKHAFAASTSAFLAEGKNEEARRLVDSARHGELQIMVSLFRQLKDLVRETARELAVVISTPSNTFAVSIDRTVGVENIPADRIQSLDTAVFPRGWGLGQTVAPRVAQRSASLAIILHPESLDPTASKPAARGAHHERSMGCVDPIIADVS